MVSEKVFVTPCCFKEQLSSRPTYPRAMRRLARMPGQNRTAGRSIHRLGAGSVGRRVVRLSYSVTPDPLVGGKPF